MKRNRILLGIAALALMLGSAAMADTIYKWTDEEGNVHYEDRPTGSANAERMAISYRRTDAGSVQQRVQAHTESTAARNEARAAAAEETKVAEAKAAEAAENAKRCESYRATLQTLANSRRVYREEADGNRVYLDEQAQQETRQRLEDRIAEHCTS